METDFPAAHSMDTCWFAIDQDGHVARFDTGEAGAVPSGALAGDEAHELSQRLGSLLPATDVLYDLEGRQPPGPGDRGSHLGFVPGSAGILVFLQSLDPVREDIDAGRAVEVPATAGVAVIFNEITEQRRQQLHETKACQGCFWHFSSEEGALSAGLAQRGIFEYSHLTENWISGPYGREEQPRQPIHIDQLPPGIRTALRQLRLNIRFAETPHIQPIEHTDCYSWEAAYMNVTGTHIRPIPGMEDEYPEAYANMDHLPEHIQVEPPDGEPEEDEE